MTLDQKVFEDLAMEATDLFYTHLIFAKEEGNLYEFFENHGMLGLLPQDYRDSFLAQESYGKIILIGDSSIGTDIIRRIFKDFGISSDRVELYLDYNKLTNRDFTGFRYSLEKYSHILAGPMPHSMKVRGQASSLINLLDSTEGFPPVKRLEGSHGLKITKANLRDALEQIIMKGDPMA